jgi:hypothetical protein
MVSTISRSRIHKRTILLWFLGIILRVLRVEVSVYNVYITNQFQTTFAQGRGGVKSVVIENRAVLCKVFDTILRGASMQYKLATSQSQKPRSPLPQNIIICTLQTARERTVKIPPVHKIVLQGLCQNLQPYKVLMNK